jgi:hypothetical protein
LTPSPKTSRSYRRAVTEPKPTRPSERTRAQIEQAMRRIGLSDRIGEARRVLPEVVDLDRDAVLLLGLGLSIDRLADDLGAGPW